MYIDLWDISLPFCNRVDVPFSELIPFPCGVRPDTIAERGRTAHTACFDCDEGVQADSLEKTIGIIPFSQYILFWKGRARIQLFANAPGEAFHVSPAPQPQKSWTIKTLVIWETSP